MASDKAATDHHASPSSSGLSPFARTPPTPIIPSGRPRKQVGWAGAVAAVDANNGSSSSSSDPPSATADPSRTQQHSDEYLRSEITRIMSSPQPSRPDSPLPPPETSHRPQSPRTSETPRFPKPALRSGTATPALYATSPDEQVQNLDLKLESAARAQQNALRTIDDLQRATSEVEDVADDHRGRSKKRPHSRFGWSNFHHRRTSSVSSETSTVPEHDEEGNYIEKPKTYLSGGLSALQMLQNFARPHTPSAPSSADTSRASSPSGGFRRRLGHQKSSSMASLIGASTGIAARPGLTHTVSSDYLLPQQKVKSDKRSDSAQNLINRVARPILGSRSNSWDEKQITVQKHIRELKLRHRYIVRLCRALMLYGAPTHRLEEYMKMTARVIEIKAQFLYVPGCMIMSFDDPETHTAEIRLVKVAQGVDLGRMWDTHDIYKDVVHDIISVEEATKRLDDVMNKPDKFKTWFLVFMHGVASMSVAPFAFQADYIDLGPAFILGTILGFLRLVVAPASTLYTDIFEIVAVGITSFLARAFGSIGGRDNRLFCFSALAQSSIALILPGFHVLCGALELQSKSMVAGSVRLVYAVIFSLFVGFALTLGTAIYGFMDSDATSETVCQRKVQGTLVFPWVVLYSFSLVVINQAKWKHMPIMLIIAFAGYVVNYFSGISFAGNTQLSSTLGAITLSVFANLYSRIGAKVERFFEFVFTWIALRSAPYLPAMFRKKVEENVKEISINTSDSENDVEKQKSPTPNRAMAVLNWIKTAITNPKEVLTKDSSEGEKSVDGIDGTKESGDVKADEKPQSTQPRHVNYSLAAAAMLPGIFVLVPSGIAVQGSLLSGISSANEIVGNATGRQPIMEGNIGNTNDLSLNVGYTVVQVAIGITVGLFIGTILVYPFGKGGRGSRGMRSALFSF